MRILIIEDEVMAAKMLKGSLENYWGDTIESLQVERTLIGGQAFLQEKPIDLLFLDLDLRGESGFEIFKEVLCGTFQTIIVSANSQLAVETFEHSVLDFVPKPYSETRLHKALKLLPQSFLRIHRSYIINVKYLTQIIAKYGGNYTFILTNGESLPISRQKYTKLTRLSRLACA